MPLRITTLGGLRVYRDGDEVAALYRRPARCALLVHLVVERRLPKLTIQSTFWPLTSPRRARKALNQGLYELREALGRDWLDAEGDRLAVHDDVAVDLDELERLVAENELDRAIELIGGPFLAGFAPPAGVGFEQWAETISFKLDRLARRAFGGVIERARANGERERVVSAAEKWCRFDPLEDEAQEAMIIGLEAAGRRADAVRQFETFTAVLAELDLEPLDELARAVADIRAGSGGTATGPPPGGRPGGDVEPDPATDQIASIPSLSDVRPLARGSKADLYLADDTTLGRRVVVKVLSQELVSSGTARLRFRREIRAAARIDHPNVVTVYRGGRLPDGRPYYVMRFIEGVTLDDHLAAVGSLDAQRVRRLVGQIASALAAIHAAGVLHRDVSPGSILVDREGGGAHITDFGVAGLVDLTASDDADLTRTGEMFGVPEYRSPEHLRAEPVTDRSDVYGLGVLAFELWHGAKPERPHGSAPPTPDRDPALASLIRRCLNDEPRRRPSARDVAAALTRDGRRASWLPGWLTRVIPGTPRS